jgi:hypothetical protein
MVGERVLSTEPNRKLQVVCARRADDRAGRRRLALVAEHSDLAVDRELLGERSDRQCGGFHRGRVDVRDERSAEDRPADSDRAEIAVSGFQREVAVELVADISLPRRIARVARGGTAELAAHAADACAEVKTRIHRELRRGRLCLRSRARQRHKRGTGESRGLPHYASASRE